MAIINLYATAIEMLDTSDGLGDGAVVYTLLIDGSSGYVFSTEDSFISDVIGIYTEDTDEYNGPGYTSGHTGTGRKSQTIGSPYGIIRTSNIIRFKISDLVWAQIGEAGDSVKSALICLRMGTSMSDADRVIAYVDFGSPVSITGDDFTIQWHVDGVFKQTVSS